MHRFPFFLWFSLMPFGYMACTNAGISGGKTPGPAMQSGNSVAVVELFTSEGCSSCPPAERAVEELLQKFPENVLVLSYHVDYWDRLGWKDAFSDSRFTDRQRDYAGTFRLQSIYTPQVVVNGQTEFVGSNKAKLFRTVEEQLAKSGDKKIDLSGHADATGHIKVDYSSATGNGQKLCLALIQDEATSEIRRGENAGISMHHVRIVRDFRSFTGGKGTAEFKIPDGAAPNKWSVVAFLQKQDGLISAATVSYILP
ncbi:MAG: DUF1223 domain-containing protein [Chitinophagaceae bacterium]|nr:MAG: DUF1223 domain-containing protein [Chitinophagaceae bacterium]